MSGESAEFAPLGRTVTEYGVQTAFGIEWGASVGMSHRYEYTAESVWALAGGRPVFTRTRTIYPDLLGEPQRAYPPVTGGTA